MIIGGLLAVFCALAWLGFWAEKRHPQRGRYWHGVPTWLWVALGGGFVLLALALVPQIRMGLDR